MQDTHFSFNFLDGFIHQMFDESGFETMSEDARKQFLPSFVAEAERRLGFAYMNALDETQMKSFATLFEGEEIDQDAVKDFLEQHIPQYIDIAQKVLADFKDEFKKTLAEVS